MERRARLPVLIAPLLVLALSGAARAGSLPSLEEALAEAFPDASVEKRVEVLDDAAMSRIQELAGSRPESRIVSFHEARRDGKGIGAAFLDVHLVRSLPEAILVVVDAEGKVARVEVLAFEEPQDYLAGPKWLEQFRGRGLEPDLKLGRGIRPLGGASLTSRAITSCVRRSLALHAIFVAPGAGSGPAPGGARP